MIEKLAYFTDIKCVLIVGGLSLRVCVIFLFGFRFLETFHVFDVLMFDV